MATSVETKYRLNELGYQMISEQMLSYLGLSDGLPKIDKADIWHIKSEVTKFGNKYSFPPKINPNLPELNLELPELNGDILSHINEYANELWGPYKKRLVDFLSKGIPQLPPASVIQHQAGWVRYERQVTESTSNDAFNFEFDFEEDGVKDDYQIMPVMNPLEPEMVFDCETFVKAGNLPVMAAAVTNKAWYFWLHPSVINPAQDYQHQLISLGTDKLVLNHFVKFDSARVAETYDKSLASPGDTSGNPKANVFLCTQSMHMAVCGMSDKQTDIYKLAQKGSYTPDWVSITSPNSLIEVYNHHVQPLKRLKAADKAIRNIFVVATHCRQFHELITTLIEYTLKDVMYTYELGQVLAPKYFQSQPSLITFGGHIMLSQSFLPVPNNWRQRLGQIEKTYVRVKKRLKNSLTSLGETLAKQKITEADILADPWYCQLDWTPAKSGPNVGKPLWWRKHMKDGITTKGNLAPVILRMAWNLGTPEKPKLSPLVKHKKFGWIFKATPDFPAAFELKYGIPYLPEEHFGPGWYAKVPHKKGHKNNVGTPLAKDYIGAIDSGILCSENPNAATFLKKAKSIAYWTSMRKRADGYFSRPLGLLQDGQKVTKGMMIEPSMMGIHGTCSRRCTESLWLTVSGAKPDVIGSELKSSIQAPDGHVLVGADFDAQELKIASAYADAWKYLVHGSTAMSYTQLLGDKEDKTDGHSLLAAFVKMSRQIAKNLNFQMLYLSGLSGCAMTIKSQRPELSEDECRTTANQALALRRGKKRKQANGTFKYEGGTDSFAYNFMLTLANRFNLPSHLSHLQRTKADQNPRTPALGSAMSQAIQYRYCGGDFLTSRANWGIQSSGVDILHILLMCLEYLKEYFKLNYRFMFTYHDETWVVSPETEKYQAAMCFQIAHLWTWAYFFKQLGFNDLPWNYQWFSGVNIDKSFRKEPYEDQTTPSNPSPENNPQKLKFTNTLADGEVLSMPNLISKLTGEN